MSGCTGIEQLYFEGTAVTGVQLPNGGILKTLHLPETVTNLTIRNQKAIIRNAARCNHCGEVIESTYRHDFKTCSCGHVSVDGGHDYLRRCYASPDDYTDLSETEYLPLEEDRK